MNGKHLLQQFNQNPLTTRIVIIALLVALALLLAVLLLGAILLSSEQPG